MEGERDGLELALRFGSADTGWRWCLGSIGIDRALGVTIGTYQETTALRDAEERFQRAFEDAAIGMAITGTDGRFVRVNHSLATMLGREPQELAGVAVRDLTHPAHHDDDREAMRALAAGELQHLQHREALPARRRRRGVGRAARRPSCATPMAGPVLPLADDRHRRAPRRRAGAGPERGALPLAGRRPRRSASSRSPSDGRLAYANERLREIFGMPRASCSTASPGWSASPAEDRERARRRVPPRAGAGRARARSTCASWPASTAGRASTWRRSPRAARPADGPRRHDRRHHRRGRPPAGARRARGRVPDAGRALDGLPVAPRARRHLPLRVAGVAWRCSGWDSDAMLGRTPRGLGHRPRRRRWRSSSSTGSRAMRDASAGAP